MSSSSTEVTSSTTFTNQVCFTLLNPFEISTSTVSIQGVIPKKDYRWSIDFKVVEFKKGFEAEVVDKIALEMIEKGYASDATKKVAPTSKGKSTLINSLATVK